jgi:protein translocase SecG subunit
MYTFILILMAITSLLLIVSVMFQNSKSDGMQSSLGSMGGNKLIGVKKTVDGLERITWILGIVLLSLALLASIVLKKSKNSGYRTVNTELASSLKENNEKINDEGADVETVSEDSNDNFEQNEGKKNEGLEKSEYNNQENNATEQNQVSE